MYEIRIRYKSMDMIEHRILFSEALEYANRFMRDHKYSRAEVWEGDIQLSKVIKEKTGNDSSFSDLFKGY